MVLVTACCRPATAPGIAAFAPLFRRALALFFLPGSGAIVTIVRLDPNCLCLNSWFRRVSGVGRTMTSDGSDIQEAGYGLPMPCEPRNRDASPSKMQGRSRRKVGLRLRSLALLFCLAAPICSSYAQAPETGVPLCRPIETGFSLTFSDIDAAKAKQCDDAAGRPVSGAPELAITEPSNNIVLHYDDPSLRHRVRRDFGAMRSEGATVLRVHLWYRHTEDQQMSLRLSRRQDPLGLAVATEGRLPPASLPICRRSLQMRPAQATAASWSSSRHRGLRTQVPET